MGIRKHFFLFSWILSLKAGAVYLFLVQKVMVFESMVRWALKSSFWLQSFSQKESGKSALEF